MQHRGRLLTRAHTGWYRPGAISLPGGDVGRHLLHISMPSRATTLTSEPTDISPPSDLEDFEMSLDRGEKAIITAETVARMELVLRKCFKLPLEGPATERVDVLDGLCALLV